MRITEKIGGKINHWLLDRKTLRGAMMSFDRPSRTPNGRIRLVIQDAAADLPAKIVEPAMQEILCQIWRFNQKPAVDQGDSSAPDECVTNPGALPGGLSLKIG
jgi:hypothetical protein